MNYFYVTHACNLGIIFDLILSLDPHIKAVSKSCCLFLHKISKMQSSLPIHKEKTLIQAFTILFSLLQHPLLWP